MIERLRAFPDPTVDAWLLIDDEDCRFCPKPSSPPDIQARLAACRAELTQRIAAAGVATRPLHVLVALPEIEAWLLRDPLNEIERHLHNQELTTASHVLCAFVEPRSPLESFGCPRVGAACSRKLSDELTEWLAASVSRREFLLRCSKRLDGPALLSRLDPGPVIRGGMPWFEACVRPLQRLA